MRCHVVIVICFDAFISRTEQMLFSLRGNTLLPSLSANANRSITLRNRLLAFV